MVQGILTSQDTKEQGKWVACNPAVLLLRPSVVNRKHSGIFQCEKPAGGSVLPDYSSSTHRAESVRGGNWLCCLLQSWKMSLEWMESPRILAAKLRSGCWSLGQFYQDFQTFLYFPQTSLSMEIILASLVDFGNVCLLCLSKHAKRNTKTSKIYVISWY